MQPDILTRDVAGPSPDHRQQALLRQSSLTKPLGSLGRLEDVAVTLCALQRTDRPRAERVPVIVFAADHGVTAQGVSPYPSEVTTQMMVNFVSGGAAISVLARTLGLPLEIVDVGTIGAPVPGVVADRVARGTADLTRAPAMTHEEVDAALASGAAAVERAGDPGLLVLGEMGIGNTTSASALAAAYLELDPDGLTGPGAGLDRAGVERKRDAVARALELHREPAASADDPALDTLRRLGGLEIVALTGAVLTAARRGTPVLVDGFIVSVAALAAVRLVPACRPWLLFGTRSAEPGHDAVLDALDADPLLDLRLRLGEGSGAALALPLVRSACDLHTSMATFAEAAVSGPAA